MTWRAAAFVTVFLLCSYAGGSLQAYLDPGTGSLVLQALLGGVVGALTLGKLYWRKIKAFVLRREDSDHSSSDGGAGFSPP